ncbi:unnamed protein product [Timema podura]|uniref:Uncharacterized protein n=1 Tax=Timema podura TaxID=61482 RepID=A0ABN7PCG0_TIMPD|nr:unnamed protein product [Timema podura]
MTTPYSTNKKPPRHSRLLFKKIVGMIFARVSC